MNFFITGRPGVGKTTLIKELTRDLGGRIDGFYTEEIRKEGKRSGFGISALNGKKGILASIDIESPYKLGKYRVDLKDFERVALPAIKNALKSAKTIIIDEIGPMELFSKKFREIVVEALNSPNSVVATIKLKGSKFVEALKSRHDIIIYTLTPSNRREIREKILAHIVGGVNPSLLS